MFAFGGSTDRKGIFRGSDAFSISQRSSNAGQLCWGLRFQCFGVYQALKFALSCQLCAIEGSELTPSKNFGRAFLLNDAMVDLGEKTLVAAEVGVKGPLPQALVADHVRSIAGFV